MTAPLARGPIDIRIKDELMSAPYVHMTIGLMKKFEADANSDQNKVFIVKPSKYVSPGRIFVEGDASSASYFLAGAAITGGSVTVHGCGSASVQADALFAHVLGKMGAIVEYADQSITVTRDPLQPLQGIDEDCGDIPDVAYGIADFSDRLAGVSVK